MPKRMLLALTLLWTTTAVAAPPTKESIDTLLAVTKMERTFDNVMDSMTRVMQQQTASAFAGSALTEEQQRAMRDKQAKMAAVIRDELSFAKLEPIYVDVYRETFTQDEVDSLIAFYRTPAGASYVDKMPEVLRRTTVAMQPLMKETMERVKAIAKQSADDAKAAPSSVGPSPRPATSTTK